ncbi:MAG: hypothetical protein C0402_06445 [Thermodesulfovibrio sp.]|nr:hypothetical protein [Thermodesulfovibrio sp.]
MFQGALGQAYLLSNLLLHITANPFAFHTAYALLLIFLSGTFFFLFLREMGLNPIACFTAAAGFSTSPLMFYWISFGVFLSTFCWTLAVLWLVARFVRTPSAWNWVGLVFSAYSLFATGNPQSVVLSCYFLAIFSVTIIAGNRWELRRKLVVVSWLGLAVLMGMIASLPAYLDIYIAAKNSARLNVGDSYFVKVLPSINSLSDFGNFVKLFFDPYLPGNPISEEYPFRYEGISLTPVFCMLFLLSFGVSLKRKIWGWQAFVFFCFVTTLWPAAYLVLVHYFGFSLSRMQTLGIGLIPCFIAIAYTIDEIVSVHRLNASTKPAVILATFLIGALMMNYGLSNHDQLSIFRISVALIVLIGAAVFIITRSQPLLCILVVITALAYGKPLLLFRPLDKISTASSLTMAVKDALPEGSRYAFAGQTPLLPPNMESLLGLQSIHTYNSLSSRNYQQYIKGLGGETRVYGRHSRFIAGDRVTEKEAFSYSGIGVVLSPGAIQDAGLRLIGQQSGLHMYKPVREPVLFAQLTVNSGIDEARVFLRGPVYEQPSLEARRLEKADDYQKYQVTDYPGSTTLFISQQYHPLWKAKTDMGPATTALVNDFFLGVNVPAGAHWVTIEYCPYVYWSFIPQILFLLAAAVYIVLLARTRFRKEQYSSV